MKRGWQIRPLEELVVQDKAGIKIGPFGSQLKKCDLVSNGIHVLGIENVLSGKFDELGERYISQEKFQTLESVEVVPGDLLLTMMGTIGKVAVVPPSIRRSIMDSHLLRMRPDQHVIRTDYLAWAIQGSTAVLDAIEAQAHGAIMKGLNSAIVRSLPVPVPPLAEQQQIVGKLTEAFDSLAIATANAERNLRNARALFKSHLHSVFTQRGKGWVEKQLENVVDENCTLSYGIVQPGHDFPNGLPIVRPTDLIAKVITLDGLKRIDPKLAEGYRRTTLRGDELLLCVRGSTGVVSMTGLDLVGANVTRGIVPIVFDSSILRQDFGYFMMTSEAVQRQIRAKTYGAALMQINIGDLRKIVVSFPTLKEQKELAAKLDLLAAETQRLESIYQQKLAALSELKKSLLHQAFSGQL